MANEKNKKGRKWQLTINNPLDYGFDHDKIIATLESLKLDYFCLCDEIGNENKTPHTHIYIYKESTVRFSRLKKLFPQAHIEFCYGSHKENRDYIRKEGKYADSDKKETNLIETFYECGELPSEDEKKYDDKRLLQKLIDDAYTNEEIIRQYPQFTYRIKQINELRYTLKYTKYQTKDRNVKVFYLYGETATGKSRFVHSLFDPNEIYVVSDYEHPFDSYQGQRVIVFEEFRSSIKYSEMLQYLDRYPCQLPARYMQKWACYEYVFIISNIPLERQYYHIFEDKASEMAFYRRINYMIVFKKEYIEEFDRYIYSKVCYRGNEDIDKMEECDLPEIRLEEENDEEQMERKILEGY